MASHELQFSVGLLKEYWKKISTLREGEALLSLSISQMPPWNDLCSELAWETHSIEGGYFSEKNHGRCGVYRLIALASEDDLTRPATLSRVCGQDTTGTLYIGEAKSLNIRLNQLRRSARLRSFRREKTHGAINMLRKIPVLNYPTNRLAVALCFTITQTRIIEEHLIYAYMNSFGEMPPLNYKSNARG
jgi:hypothetical protein